MKKINEVIIALAIIAITAWAYAFARIQDDGHKVKVKIVKIVDGDTTVTEKIMDKAELADINKEINAVKGKNVKIMMYVQNQDENEEKEKKEEKISTSKSFSFNLDSLARTCRIEMNLDSIVNAPGNSFNFTVVTDEDNKTGRHGKKKVIINKSGSSSFSFNTDSLDMNMKIIEDEGDSKSSTIVVVSPGNKNEKKVTVKSSVFVIEDNNKPSGKKKPGDKDEEASGALKFYPNPNDGKFTIEYDFKSKETALITITDASGKQLFKDEVKGGGRYSRQVDLGDKGKGVFILNLQQGKKSISSKIIIE